MSAARMKLVPTLIFPCNGLISQSMVHSLGHYLSNCPLPIPGAKKDIELPLRIHNGNVESHDPEES